MKNHHSNQQQPLNQLTSTRTTTTTTTPPSPTSPSDSNSDSATSSKSKSKTIINQSNQTQPIQQQQQQKQQEHNNNNNNNLSSKRLTRSTYIGDEDHSTSTRKRSSSTDSENGWIPPPPLLPLQTEFLITNNPKKSFIQSIHQTNPINHSLRFAHLKCPDRSNESLIDQEALETPSFRLIQESELLLGSKRIKTESSSNTKSDWGENEESMKLKMIKKHKTSEMLEKRSKRLEKEKLIHERFKLKSHLNLLKNPTGIDWKTVRSITLRRIKEEERRRNGSAHQRKNPNQTQTQSQVGLINDGERENEKVERMRWIMVKEAQETLERYDKLLDTRKPMIKARQLVVPPPPPPPIPILDPVQINSPQSASSPPVVPSKRQLPASDRIGVKRNKVNKLLGSEESDPRALHISLKIKTPVQLKESKPIASSSKTKIKIQSRGRIASSSRQAKEETEGSEPEESDESDESEEIEESKRSSPPLVLQEPLQEPLGALKGRESLYECESIRRMILEEGLIVGGERRRKVGRNVYGFGLRVPEMDLMKFEAYGFRLDSMSVAQGLKYSSFLKFNEVLPPRSTTKSNELTNESSSKGVEEEEEDWIEFEPRLEEIKALVKRRDEFGIGSGYFDLIDELEALEDEMMERGEGKSLRRLMFERVILKDEMEKD